MAGNKLLKSTTCISSKVFLIFLIIYNLTASLNAFPTSSHSVNPAHKVSTTISQQWHMDATPVSFVEADATERKNTEVELELGAGYDEEDELEGLGGDHANGLGLEIQTRDVEETSGQSNQTANIESGDGGKGDGAEPEDKAGDGEKKTKGMSGCAIAGLVIGVFFFIVVVICFIYKINKDEKKKAEQMPLHWYK